MTVKERHERVYGVTSLAPERARAHHLLRLLRGHWHIESRHYVRDVTFGEDHSRPRGGEAPQIRAALRNLALTLIRRTGHTAIAEYRRHLSAHPVKALRLLRPKRYSRR